MNISTLTEAKAAAVRTTSDDLIIELVDGREIKVPLTWFPKLFHSSPAQRKKYRLIGDGIGIHWADLDEDLSVAGLLGIRQD